MTKKVGKHRQFKINDHAIMDVIDELHRATDKFGPFKSGHEGYAVILEELDELWDAVKLNTSKHPERRELMRAKAVQVAAMALRFVVDVTPLEPCG